MTESQSLANKKTLLVFTASLLFVSFAASVLPSVNALTARTDFSNRHTTESWGNSLICGDHKCKPGEMAKWDQAVWGRQNESQGKIMSALQHGEDVMHKLAGSTPASQTGHGSEKPTIHSTMPIINATKSENMTGNMPNTK